MSSSVTYDGSAFTIPDPNDRDWATGTTGLTAYLTRLAAQGATLSGSQTLTNKTLTTTIFTGTTNFSGATVTGISNQVAMMIGGPGGSALTAGTYYFTPGASRPMTIQSALVYVIGTGTATVAIQIAGVNVTSLGALAATTSSTATTNATGANAVVVGNTITVVVSAASVAAGSSLLIALNYVG